MPSSGIQAETFSPVSNTSPLTPQTVSQHAARRGDAFFIFGLIKLARLRKPRFLNPNQVSELDKIICPIRSEHLLFSVSPAAGGMKEQDLMCIKLHGVNRIGLKKIIDFIYTAKLSLNMENLQDTLEAASFLQILPVLDFCKVFLISGVRKRILPPAGTAWESALHSGSRSLAWTTGRYENHLLLSQYQLGVWTALVCLQVKGGGGGGGGEHVYEITFQVYLRLLFPTGFVIKSTL